MTQPLDRPEALPGQTYKLHWPDSEHAIYITINDIVQDGRRRPFEIFINSKNMEHYAWTVALTRMISAVFRRGGDVSFVVEEMKAVFDPRGGAWMDGRYVPSLLAAIGDVIERHMIDIGFLQSGRPGTDPYAAGPLLAAVGETPRAADQRYARDVGSRARGDARRLCAPVPEMRQPVVDPSGRLRHLHELRLQQVRLSGPRHRGLISAVTRRLASMRSRYSPSTIA